MVLSLFMAKLVGLSLFIAGLGLLLNSKHAATAANKIIKDEGLLFTTGLIMIAAGSAVVLTHNVWAANWSVLVTIVGWGILIKGFFMLAFPKVLEDVYRYVTKVKGIMMIGAAVWMIFGLLLLYYGFYS